MSWVLVRARAWVWAKKKGLNFLSLVVVVLKEDECVQTESLVLGLGHIERCQCVKIREGVTGANIVYILILLYPKKK